MEEPPSSREPTTALRSPPLQARAMLFFKKLGLRARGQKKKKQSRETMTIMSPVTIPTHDYQRAHSFTDLRKPDISRLIGIRTEEGPNPVDTDDSSQDASTSGNSPVLRHRRYSAWESLQTAPADATFAVHGAAPLFCREQARIGAKLEDDALGTVLAPAALFLRSNQSLDVVLAEPQPQTSTTESLSLPSPDPAPQSVPLSDSQLGEDPIPESLTQEEEVVQRDDDTPRPSGDASFHSCTPMTTPSTDRDPSIPPESTSSSSSSPFPPLLESQSRLAPEASHSEDTSLLTRHPSTFQPPPFRVTTERGLRLSPSVITRHPMPILNLPALPSPPLPPPLPVPSSSSSTGKARTKVPLTSMPLLSRHGRRDTDIQADHETAVLGYSSEEDAEEGDVDGDDEEEQVDGLSVHQSDEDDEDDEPSSTSPSVLQGFKSAQKRRMREEDMDSPMASPVTPVSPQDNFSGPNLAEYVCSKTHPKTIQTSLGPEDSPSTIHPPFSPTTPRAEDIQVHLRNTLNPDSLIPGARLEGKLSLYRVASQSMIDLGSTRRAERGLHRIKSWDTFRSIGLSVAANSTEGNEASEESDTEIIGRLLRRTSMPSFHPTSAPPPYPSFDPRPREHRVSPREDEEREPLPAYSNSLYLLAVMPRKMEFSSPGVQAKDRKWRRMVCELEGTAFRVYKCPPGASGGGVLGDWWEKRVGVGDVASPTASVPRQRKKEEFERERSSKLGMDQTPPTSTPVASSSSGSTTVPPATRQTRARSESQSSSMAAESTRPTPTPTPRAVKRMSGASFFSPFRRSDSRGGVETPSRPASRAFELLPVDIQSNRSSLSADSHGANGRATPVAQPSPAPQPRSASRLSFLPGASSRLQWRTGETPKPHPSDLLRAYTLQHAESGLGNDYLKRKNVIRVRLEGEQFLLQAPNVPLVVEWIEGLHAGANIALDLDQRVMPRGPMFPRRRRRRARRTTQVEDAEQAESVAPHRMG